MAVLSTPGPMAVLSMGKLFAAKACPMAVLSTRGPMAVLSTPGPMVVLSKQRQRMARLSNFSRKWQFRYYPAQAIYQRPGQAIFSKSRPNGRFINARSNGFYQREAQWPFYQRQAHWPFYQGRNNGWPDLQISAANGNFAIIPHNHFISGRANNSRFINARSNSRYINARPSGRFIKVEATGWPGKTSRFQQQFATSLLSRTINLSAAGPSYFQAKAGPIVLSTPGPMAVLTTGKPFSAKACPMAVLSTRGPMAVL